MDHVFAKMVFGLIQIETVMNTVEMDCYIKWNAMMEI